MADKTFNSVAEAAAAISGDPEMKDAVEKEIAKSELVMMMVRMRMQKGMSQKQVAKVMGASASRISRLESGVDSALKLDDIIGYTSALGMGMSLMFEDDSLPAADRIKQHVMSIHRLLEELVQLADEVDGDTQITDKIHQFCGDVLFNFLARFSTSYSKLCNVIKFSEGTDSSSPRVELADQLASALPKPTTESVPA